jgi:hypothetical protein
MLNKLTSVALSLSEGGLPHGLCVQWVAVVAVGYDVAALNRFEKGYEECGSRMVNSKPVLIPVQRYNIICF